MFAWVSPEACSDANAIHPRHMANPEASLKRLNKICMLEDFLETMDNVAYNYAREATLLADLLCSPHFSSEIGWPRILYSNLTLWLRAGNPSRVLSISVLPCRHPPFRLAFGTFTQTYRRARL